MIPLMRHTIKFIEKEWWFPETGGRGNGMLFNGYRVSTLQDERVWRLVAQRCKCT